MLAEEKMIGCQLHVGVSLIECKAPTSFQECLQALAAALLLIARLCAAKKSTLAP